MSRLLSITVLWLLLLFAAQPASGVMSVQPRNGTWEMAADGYEPALDVRDGPNLYAYVKQNPWTSWDPHGLATVMVSSNDEDEPEVHSNLVQEEKKAEIDDTTSSIRANVETSKKSYTLDHSKVGTKVTASAQGDKWVAEEIATKWDAYDRKVNAEKYAMQDALIEAAINIPLLLLPGGPLTKGSLTELAVARSGSRSLAAKTPLALPAPRVRGNPNTAPTYEKIIVDPKGNAIPLKPGETVVGSPDGRFIQVRDASGQPTGLRIDGPHKPASHPDPRAQAPHAHVPGVTNPDGTPWLPVK